MLKSSDGRPLKTPCRQRVKNFSAAANPHKNLVRGVFPVDPFLRNFMLQADHGSE
jgi:hypothetical protein